MSSSRAVLFHGANRPLEVAQFDVPVPCGGEVLVRVACCALCRSDLHTHAGRRPGPVPAVLGHEIVGQVAAFGPDAPRVDLHGQHLTEGDRITWALAASCGHCFFCREQLPQKCERLFKYGHQRITPQRPFAGGLADHVLLVPGTACLRVPDEIPDALAALANCATATAAAALRCGGPLVGRTVLIFGAGVLGLTACAMARSGGAAAVLVCEPDAARRGRAAAFGATHAIAPDPEGLAAAVAAVTAGRGADVVLELAGAAESVQLGLAAARTGGTVVLAGTVLPTAPVVFNPEEVVRRMLTVRGVHNYAPHDLAAAVAFLAAHSRAYPFLELVGASFRLDNVEQAFAHAHAHPGSRVVITPT